MGDNRLAEAVDIVAKRALRNAASAPDCEPLWEDYPDIGEHDWALVEERLHDLVELIAPDEGTFEAAYDYLKERSDG